MYSIEVKNLCKDFPLPKKILDVLLFRKRKFLKVLNNVSFNLSYGEIFIIMGKNGTGKTTLLRALSNLLIPEKGTILINDKPVSKYGTDLSNILSFVNSEERSFYWRLSAYENLEFFGTLLGLKKSQLKKNILSSLRRVDLIKHKDFRFDKYSSGMKQRLSIARGFLNKPKIILLDEPTRNLDPFHAKEIRELIKRLSNSKTAIIIATNNPEDAFIGDKLSILKNHKLSSFKKIDEKNLKRISELI